MKLASFLLATSTLAAPVSQQQGNAVVLSGQSTFRPPGAQLIAAVEKDKRDEVVELITGSRRGYEAVDINAQNYLGRSVLQCAAQQASLRASLPQLNDSARSTFKWSNYCLTPLRNLISTLT